MADVEKYISWSLDGHKVCAQVTKTENDTVYATLPSKQIITLNTKEISLSDISKDEYESYIHGIIDFMTSEYNYSGAKSMELSKQLEDLMAENQSLKSNIDSLNENLKTSQSLNDELTNKLLVIEQESKANSRFSELSDLEATSVIESKDEQDLKNQLGTMPDNVYSAIVNTARTMRKLTEVTQTNLPKLSDQSQTTEPKLTESEVDDTLQSSEKDTNDNGSDISLSSVSGSDDTVQNEFAEAMVKYFAKNSETE